MTVKELKDYLNDASDNAEVFIVSGCVMTLIDNDNVEIKHVTGFRSHQILIYVDGSEWE